MVGENCGYCLGFWVKKNIGVKQKIKRLLEMGNWGMWKWKQWKKCSEDERGERLLLDLWEWLKVWMK